MEELQKTLENLSKDITEIKYMSLSKKDVYDRIITLLKRKLSRLRNLQVYIERNSQPIIHSLKFVSNREKEMTMAFLSVLQFELNDILQSITKEISSIS